MQEQRLYAFWNYDQFPYCLCGEVINFLPGGRVKVVEYGGRVFQPFLVVPYEEGVQIQKSLSTLTQCYEEEKQELKESYTEKILRVIDLPR